MALNDQKVLFQYGLGTAAGAKNAGAITFDSVNKAIYVGDGAAANLVTSRVKDASFASNKLTISFVDGSEAIALDFSDVASTKNVMAVFTQLDASIGANTTAISANTTAISEEAEARVLADLSIRADFAADLTAHSSNGDIHVTAQQKTDWQNATNAINAFLADNAASNTALDTLKEIQDFLTSDDGTVETLLADVAANKEDISTNASNIGDVSTRVSELEDDTHTHSNKELLDTYNQTNEDLTDAVSKKHEHSNKTVLDGITSDKVSAWDAAEQNAKDDAAAKYQVKGDYEAAGAAAQALEDAKYYADLIKVNGQGQTTQEITITGANILIGGTGSHKDASVALAIEDLYTEVGKAANAGVQSLAVNADSSVYAGVNAATGAVTLTIKKVAIADASDGNTGVADALDVKNSIEVAKSAVVGSDSDEASANTVYGAKAYADAAVEAAALKWTVLGE